MEAFKITKDKLGSTIVPIRKMTVNSGSILLSKRPGRHAENEKWNEHFAKNTLTAQVGITVHSFSGQELWGLPKLTILY
jgi:hypothetical protein